MIGGQRLFSGRLASEGFGRPSLSFSGKPAELARGQLLSKGVQTPDRGNPTARRGAISCIVTLLLLSLLAPADARTRHHRKTNPLTVALQPFLIAHSVVHHVAEPIVRHATRAAFTLATAPVQLAYRSARDSNAEVRRGESAEDEELPPAVARAVPFDEPATYDQPVRVAYLVPRPKRQHPPRAERATQDYEDFPQGIEESDPGNGDRPTVAINRAILRNGIAYAPERAPQSVKDAIWAVNSLRHKPYMWGGGHGSFSDSGYDCSGTVSFALRGAGAIAAPLPSSDLMRFGERGRGRWFTIYARPGHTFAVIAGLRLDTTDFQDTDNTGPRWHADLRDTRGYVARHPAGL